LNVEIGKIIQGEAHRDAIHVAVAPVTAQTRILPGQLVDKDGGMGGRAIGIADPFLPRAIESGERFYIFLFPGSVTSLRHEWTHPDFDLASERELAEAIAWIRTYAEQHSRYDGDDAYGIFIENARNGVICFNGSDLCGDDLPERDLVFRFLSIILGRPVSADGFSYSCNC
jgi:hypothetical protein